jgi:hypothetical protein
LLVPQLKIALVVPVGHYQSALGMTMRWGEDIFCPPQT